MNDKSLESEMQHWFSTYGVLTAQRVFSQLNIILDDKLLIATVKNPLSVYYQMIQVPIKNVYNGIILQQAQDYLIYGQKIFIDYLLSGESDKDKNSPGADTREQLDSQRLALMEMAEDFNKKITTHQKLIAESQIALKQVAEKIKEGLRTITSKIKQVLQAHHVDRDDKLILKAIQNTFISFDKLDNSLISSATFWKTLCSMLEIELAETVHQEIIIALGEMGHPRDDVKKLLSPFMEAANDLGIAFRNYRRQFHSFIITANDLIKLLSDYHPDKAKNAENLSALEFDSLIGGDAE